MATTSPLRKRLLVALAGTLLSASGITLVATHEGQSFSAYPDPARGWALPTICRGHTGSDVYRGLTVTQDQCDVWFAQDLKRAERGVQALVRVPLMQGEYDAYTSFVFNLGAKRFADSTMLDKLNKGDHKGACNEFPRWKYANGMVLQGIVVRRTAEQTECHKYGGTVYDPRK